ncbi:hypothetical protein EJ06DRAFT_110717 [Trichodelitschia bisporula]|uniref:Uncharacterized protein n=1 Tax=Trichodelitschia bisporula TaxID=703511 RepID=A0A6G1HRM1_9PEZI|nr:hypothetical protein EJ06DRAFT_110717 [Trichodelitschia bisporula]
MKFSNDTPLAGFSYQYRIDTMAYDHLSEGAYASFLFPQLLIMFFSALSIVFIGRLTRAPIPIMDTSDLESELAAAVKYGRSKVADNIFLWKNGNYFANSTKPQPPVDITRKPGTDNGDSSGDESKPGPKPTTPSPPSKTLTPDNSSDNPPSDPTPRDPDVRPGRRFKAPPRLEPKTPGPFSPAPRDDTPSDNNDDDDDPSPRGRPRPRAASPPHHRGRSLVRRNPTPVIVVNHTPSIPSPLVRALEQLAGTVTSNANAAPTTALAPAPAQVTLISSPNARALGQILEKFASTVSAAKSAPAAPAPAPVPLISSPNAVALGRIIEKFTSSATAVQPAPAAPAPAQAPAPAPLISPNTKAIENILGKLISAVDSNKHLPSTSVSATLASVPVSAVTPPLQDLQLPEPAIPVDAPAPAPAPASAADETTPAKKTAAADPKNDASKSKTSSRLTPEWVRNPPNFLGKAPPAQWVEKTTSPSGTNVRTESSRESTPDHVSEAPTPEAPKPKTPTPPAQTPQKVTPPAPAPKTPTPPDQAPKTPTPPAPTPKTLTPPAKAPKTPTPPAQTPEAQTPPALSPLAPTPPAPTPRALTPPALTPPALTPPAPPAPEAITDQDQEAPEPDSELYRPASNNEDDEAFREIHGPSSDEGEKEPARPESVVKSEHEEHVENSDSAPGELPSDDSNLSSPVDDGFSTAEEVRAMEGAMMKSLKKKALEEKALEKVHDSPSERSESSNEKPARAVSDTMAKPKFIPKPLRPPRPSIPGYPTYREFSETYKTPLRSFPPTTSDDKVTTEVQKLMEASDSSLSELGSDTDSDAKESEKVIDEAVERERTPSPEASDSSADDKPAPEASHETAPKPKFIPKPMPRPSRFRRTGRSAYQEFMEKNRATSEQNRPAIETNPPAIETNPPATETNPPATETQEPVKGSDSPVSDDDSDAMEWQRTIEETIEKTFEEDSDEGSTPLPMRTSPSPPAGLPYVNSEDDIDDMLEHVGDESETSDVDAISPPASGPVPPPTPAPVVTPRPTYDPRLGRKIIPLRPSWVRPGTMTEFDREAAAPNREPLSSSGLAPPTPFAAPPLVPGARVPSVFDKPLDFTSKLPSLTKFIPQKADSSSSSSDADDDAGQGTKGGKKRPSVPLTAKHPNAVTFDNMLFEDLFRKKPDSPLSAPPTSTGPTGSAPTSAKLPPEIGAPQSFSLKKDKQFEFNLSGKAPKAKVPPKTPLLPQFSGPPPAKKPEASKPAAEVLKPTTQPEIPKQASQTTEPRPAAPGAAPPAPLPPATGASERFLLRKGKKFEFTPSSKAPKPKSPVKTPLFPQFSGPPPATKPTAAKPTAEAPKPAAEAPKPTPVVPESALRAPVPSPAVWEPRDTQSAKDDDDADDNDDSHNSLNEPPSSPVLNPQVTKEDLMNDLIEDFNRHSTRSSVPPQTSNQVPASTPSPAPAPTLDAPSSEEPLSRKQKKWRNLEEKKKEKKAAAMALAEKYKAEKAAAHLAAQEKQAAEKAAADKLAAEKAATDKLAADKAAAEKADAESARSKKVSSDRRKEAGECKKAELKAKKAAERQAAEDAHKAEEDAERQAAEKAAAARAIEEEIFEMAMRDATAAMDARKEMKRKEVERKAAEKPDRK